MKERLIFILLWNMDLQSNPHVASLFTTVCGTISRMVLNPHAVNTEFLFTFMGAVSGCGICFDVWVGK